MRTKTSLSWLMILMVGWYFYGKVKMEEPFTQPCPRYTKISWMRQGRPNPLKKWFDILLWDFFGFGLPNRKEVPSKICYWKHLIEKDTYRKIETGTSLHRWHWSIWKGSLAEVLEEHHEKKNQQVEIEEKHILFYNCKDVCRYHVNAITFLYHKKMYVTIDSERIVAICLLTFNSVGIGEFQYS